MTSLRCSRWWGGGHDLVTEPDSPHVGVCQRCRCIFVRVDGYWVLTADASAERVCQNPLHKLGHSKAATS